MLLGVAIMWKRAAVVLLPVLLTACSGFHGIKGLKENVNKGKDYQDCVSEIWRNHPIVWEEYMSAAAYDAPAETRCTTTRNLTDTPLPYRGTVPGGKTKLITQVDEQVCERSPAHWEPAEYSSRDVNSDKRDAAYRTCMQRKGLWREESNK